MFKLVKNLRHERQLLVANLKQLSKAFEKVINLIKKVQLNSTLFSANLFS